MNVALVYCSFKSLLTVQHMLGEGEEAPYMLNHLVHTRRGAHVFV